MADPLDRLRAANPVPVGTPPPLSRVLRQIEADGHALASPPVMPASHRGGRVITAVGIGTAVLVVVAVILVVLVGHRPTPATSVTRPTPASPRLAALHRQGGQLLGSVSALRARLNTLKGLPIVVVAWASWCQPCQSQAAMIDAAASRYGATVAFVGLDIQDQPQAARAWLADHASGFPSYQINLNQLTLNPFRQAGSPRYVPFTMAIDRQGRLVGYHAGAWKSLPPLLAWIGPLSPPPTPLPAIPASLRKAFAVFRRPQTPDDVPPPGTPGMRGVNPQLVRHVGPAGSSTYLVPIRGGVLLISPNGTEGVSVAEATTAGLFSVPTETSGSPGSGRQLKTVIGVVPDGVLQVTFKLQDGGSVTVPVHENLVQARLRSPFSISFVEPSGQRITSGDM